MRLNTSSSSLFALSSLFFLTSSLPFAPRRVALPEPLVRRATYSVVPVDGGGAATSANGPTAVTILETIVQTPAPATKTIIDTETLSPITDIIISTKTIEGPETTQTALVTITPSPLISTAYSIIDVSFANPPTVTITIPEPSVTSALSLSSSATTTSSSATTTVSSTITSSPSNSTTTTPISSETALSTSSSESIISLPTSTITTSATPLSTSSASLLAATSGLRNATSTSASYTLTSSGSTSTTITASSFSGFPVWTIGTATSVSTSTTKSYDNGQWHTSYPAWSNSTWTPTPALKAAQATSAAQILPTLEPSSIVVPQDSVPGVVIAETLGGTAGKRDLSAGTKSGIIRSQKMSRISREYDDEEDE